jgi:endonuclease/exonuclease/phosphatase (EEP) superfamily protein YafD
VPGPRQLGVLTAARDPMSLLPRPPVPWAERVLCVAVGDVEIVNLHSPMSPAPERAKLRTHEAVAAYRAGAPPGPRILCGDLNTPRCELRDGDVLTFADDRGCWRLDHVLAHRLRPVAAAYAHDWRRSDLSDHSALVVDVAR